MSSLRISSAALAALITTALLSVTAMPAQAANWKAVVTGKYEIIEIDKSRIAKSGSSVTGWSRIKLERDVNDPGGVYNAIHAQNQYDCDGRRFTTLQRAYYNGEQMVREEAVSRQRANNVVPGSIDERLLNEACRASTISEAPGIAETASLAAAKASDADRPSPMRADMRTLADNSKARVLQVNDPAPAAEKPRRIALPPIDKAAADQAAASARPGAATAATPVTPAAPAAAHGAAPAAAAHGAPAAAHGAAPKVVEPKIPAAAAHGAVPDPAGNVDKRARELQLATSGPRKAPKKKAVDPHANPAANMHVHWSYEGEGAPSNWSKLDAKNAACATGKRQSPIDIREGIKVDLEGIKFDYKPTQFRIIDNGHTVQVTVGDGLSMTVMGRRYDLLQFHFHRPSEERVNGRLYDMVIHLVHKNDEGGLGVIAVLLEKGMENPVMQTLWNHMPLERDMEVNPEVAIDLNKLLPENRAYWTYMGSLTTPPCTENVLWMVFKQPTQISAEQVAIFSRLYRNNARPVQPSNGRLVKESR